MFTSFFARFGFDSLPDTQAPDFVRSSSAGLVVDGAMQSDRDLVVAAERPIWLPHSRREEDSNNRSMN